MTDGNQWKSKLLSKAVNSGNICLASGMCKEPAGSLGFGWNWINLWSAAEHLIILSQTLAKACRILYVGGIFHAHRVFACCFVNFAHWISCSSSKHLHSPRRCEVFWALKKHNINIAACYRPKLNLRQGKWNTGLYSVLNRQASTQTMVFCCLLLSSCTPAKFGPEHLPSSFEGSWRTGRDESWFEMNKSVTFGSPSFGFFHIYLS